MYSQAPMYCLVAISLIIANYKMIRILSIQRNKGSVTDKDLPTTVFLKKMTWIFTLTYGCRAIFLVIYAFPADTSFWIVMMEFCLEILWDLPAISSTLWLNYRLLTELKN